MVNYDDHPTIRELYKDWELTVICDVRTVIFSREELQFREMSLVFTSYSIYDTRTIWNEDKGNKKRERVYHNEIILFYILGNLIFIRLVNMC